MSHRTRAKAGAVAFAIICSIFLCERSSYAQWWNPFAPKDYEDCAESAAKDAKSKDALYVLLSSCASKFSGRRKPEGGYTFYDIRQMRSFDIEGPNPSAGERRYIDSQYLNYLAEQAATARRAEEARLRAEEAERQAAVARAKAKADFENRKQSARSMVQITAKDIQCPYEVTCQMFKLNLEIVNLSDETISSISIGWAFSTTQSGNCPDTFVTQHTQAVNLHPGDTITLNIDGYNGPATGIFRYCVGVTGVEIPPDVNLSVEDLRKHVLSSIGAKNYPDQMKWCRLAANKGDVFCMKQIGRLYMLGQGVAQDYSEALYWFEMAGEHGDNEAQANVGYLYYYGWGVSPDYTQAMRWFQMAADQGNASAEVGIGLMTARGDGGIKDCASAKRWFETAAAAGNETAPRARDYLRSGADGVCHW